MTIELALILMMTIMGVGGIGLAAFVIWMYAKQERRRHEGAANK